jgi:hypothetical protein
VVIPVFGMQTVAEEVDPSRGEGAIACTHQILGRDRLAVTIENGIAAVICRFTGTTKAKRHL